MLIIKVSGEERYDEDKCEFIPALKEHTLLLEHSLLSISKWEAIYKKPFLSTELDLDMIRVYAKCMTINPNVPDNVYDYLSADNISKIAEYISDHYSATWFSDSSGEKKPPHKNGRMNGEIITAEIVYYWMISYNIPVEFQKWHLSRLLTLIKVISIKNDPKGTNAPKMTAEQRRALNKQRQAKYHTRG